MRGLSQRGLQTLLEASAITRQKNSTSENLTPKYERQHRWDTRTVEACEVGRSRGLLFGANGRR